MWDRATKPSRVSSASARLFGNEPLDLRDQRKGHGHHRRIPTLVSGFGLGNRLVVRLPLIVANDRLHLLSVQALGVAVWVFGFAVLHCRLRLRRRFIARTCFGGRSNALITKRPGPRRL